MHSRTVVLVEGSSDRVALERLATRLGHDLAASAVTVESLGGVTNIRSAVRRWRHEADGPRLAGLCDANELRYFQRALAVDGVEPSRGELEKQGFFACSNDLEDELIRALGVEACIRVVDELGHLRAFETFCNQPAQRQRSDTDRLHRFFGTMSGRKEKYAGSLVDALTLDRAPRPLVEVLRFAVS